VRRVAAEKAIAEITRAAGTQIKNDRIVQELEKLVAGRELDMKRLNELKGQNLVAAAEVEAGDARIGEARVRLWERQETLNRTAGGDVLADLNKELAMLSIAMAESEVRLERLSKSVDNFAKAVDLIDELESAITARQAADAALVDAENRLADRLRTLRQYQAPVVVLVP
jgi:predicted  nucleic acid-binding Zn-ribbon protein